MTNGRVRVPDQVTSTQNLGPARPQQKMPGKNNRNKISVLFFIFFVMICIPSTSRRLEGAWRRKPGAGEGI